jgi:hypothetical protein
MAGSGLASLVVMEAAFVFACIGTMNQQDKLLLHMQQKFALDKGQFVENLVDSEIVHQGPEPLPLPRRTESADNSDALQTLRASGRVSTRRFSVWSACVLSAAFPRQPAIRWLAGSIPRPA